MTWSLIARDPATKQFGIAVATKNFAVGCRVPNIASGVGAVATQALSNPFYGVDGLKLLHQGKSAAEVVKTLVAGDDGREHRQLHVMDAAGRIAAHTGKECVDWCGSTSGDGFSVAGNMLAGPDVIADTAAFYEANATLPFASRLIGALDAGQAAGGDKRGKQSAALIIYASEEYPELSLRVDDHAEPLVELRRLHDEAQRYFIPFKKFLPTRASPAGTYDRAIINAELVRLQAAGKS
jgi:uncharacterized Ntn-hydrolase superfamily protein